MRAITAALLLSLHVASARAFAMGDVPPVGVTPWGVHTAFGADPATTLTIMWSTRVSTSSIVTLTAAGGGPQRVAGEIIPFSDVGNIQTLHRVRLTDLTPATAYSYTVGDGSSTVNATSRVFNFETPPAQNWSPYIAVFGDMGVTSNALATMPLLLADAAGGKLDVTVHIGDLA